ncbi:MAG: Coenzyme F420 hydrogenase/dehydrogenase, beta subunit C-terminal domain [Candidatus Atabeyarchaeum deiterrae]
MSSNGEAAYKESISNAQRILKGKKENFARLQREVINTGACVSCGACVASCDQLAFEEGKPKLVGKCTVCGVCYNQCPRTSTMTADLVGNYAAAFQGKSKLDKVKGQDGGVVTSLLLYALGRKLIDAAVVTSRDPQQPWKPVAKIATSEKDILEGSGSVYTHSQVVPALSNALKKGFKSIAFVGTPCNIDAIYKMQYSDVGLVHLFKGATVIRIGLFCMDSFSEKGLRTFFEKKNGTPLENISKMNIKEGKFRITIKNNGEKEFVIADLDNYRSSSCDFCTDFTSEKADISVGSVGSPLGLSTIIVRTNTGMDLLNGAAKSGNIEFKPLSEEDLTKVLNIARIKKNHRYTPKEKITYVLDSPPLKVGEPKTAEPQAKSLIKSGETKLVGAEQNRVKMTLRNDAVDCLEDLRIKITHKGEAPKDTVGWELKVDEWAPSETIELEYPRIKDDKEYNIEVQSEVNGTMFTKRILAAELNKK